MKVASTGQEATPMLTDSESGRPRTRRHDAGADALGHLQSPCFVGVDEDRRELLAAKTRHQVDVPHGLLDDACHGAQRAVAGAVAVPLVEGAEVVQVAEEEGETRPLLHSVRSPRSAARAGSGGCRGR